jgi:DNA-binding response OmpR family regulator
VLESSKEVATMGRALCVLLVEDDPILREFTARVLAIGGLEVLAAADFDDAMRAAQAAGDRLDVLVADVVLPGGLNGSELADHVRALNPSVEIVLMTGYDSETLARIGVDPTRWCFLRKPFGVHELRATIAAAGERGAGAAVDRG